MTTGDLLPRLKKLIGKRQRSAPSAVHVDTSGAGAAYAEGSAVAITWQGDSAAYEVALYDHGRRRWRYIPVRAARADLVLPEGLYHVCVRTLDGARRDAGMASGFVFFHVRDDAPGNADDSTATRDSSPRSVGEAARQQAGACGIAYNDNLLDGPPRLLLVGGAARSGTTLLQAILCADPGVNPMTAEAAPLRSLLVGHGQMLRHHRQYPGSWFDSEAALRWFTGDVLRRFLDSVATLHGSSRLVLKEPALTKWFPALHELVEDVGFIVVVRDPRDAIASMIDVAKREMTAGRPSFIANRDPVELARYYNGFYFPLFNCERPQFSRALRYIRYEDIVENPADAVARLDTACGLDLGEFRPDRPGWRSQLDFTTDSLPNRFAVTSHYNQAVSTSSVGRYRSVLDAAAIATIERHCSAIMAAFNYSKDA